MAATKTPVKTDEELKQEKEDQEQSAKLTREILRKIGRPRDLVKVGVVRVKQNTFRVNVYVENKVTTGDGTLIPGIKIEQSYFVTETSDGLVSNPPLTKVY